jgi:hypothetical protein
MTTENTTRKIQINRNEQANRVFNDEWIVASSSEKARITGRPVIRIDSAGWTPVDYVRAWGRWSTTEIMITVAFPDGRVWARLEQIDSYPRLTKAQIVEGITGIRAFNGKAASKKELIAFAENQLQDAN